MSHEYGSDRPVCHLFSNRKRLQSRQETVNLIEGDSLAPAGHEGSPDLFVRRDWDLFVRRDWDFGDAAFYGSKVSWRCL